jgi:F-type H+-transporting ATPase subunit delta
MPSGSAGRRYAQAVFDLAREQNKIEEWAVDLTNLVTTFEQADVRSFIDNPKTSRESKAQFILNVLGGKVSPTAQNLATLLVQRHRDSYIGQVREEFIRLWNRERGVVEAEVTTAEPVTLEQQALIEQKMAALTGKQVTIRYHVNPAIMGGLVAQIGDTLIDGSVRSRLENLRKQLAQ